MEAEALLDLVRDVEAGRTPAKWDPAAAQAAAEAAEALDLAFRCLVCGNAGTRVESVLMTTRGSRSSTWTR